MTTPAEPILKTKMEDMGSLRAPKPKTAGKQVTPTPDIISQSIQKETGQSPEQMIKVLAALVQKGTVKLLRIGDTVFSIMPKQAGSVEFHTFTVEDPQTLVKRFKAGVNSLKQMGYKQAVTYAESPAFVKMAKDTGLPVKISQGHQTIKGQQKPVYQFILDL
jgi:hypothetical protein